MVQEAHVQHVRPPRHRVRHAGLLLGAGAAALLDGILLRQALRWHGGGTAAAPWEGLVQLAALATLLAGVTLLHLARSRLVEPASGRVIMGSGVLGAGAYALLEGLLVHHVMALHHVHPRAQPFWDLAFLVGGILLVLAGWRLLVTAARLREGARRERPRRDGGRAL